MGSENEGDRISRMKVDKKQMKSAARLYAVQALFQMESSGQTVESVTREFETHRFGAVYDEDKMAEGDVTHFRAIVNHAVNLQARIDQTRADYDRWLDSKYAAARGHCDAILDPLRTRLALSFALEACCVVNPRKHLAI